MAPAEMAVDSDVGPGPIENVTLWERVHAHLRDEILANRLTPGTVLSEVPLAASLGVSRGPVREALGRLAAEGLVTVRPRRGAVVSALSPGSSSRPIRCARRSRRSRSASPCRSSRTTTSRTWTTSWSGRRGRRRRPDRRLLRAQQRVPRAFRQGVGKRAPAGHAPTAHGPHGPVSTALAGASRNDAQLAGRASRHRPRVPRARSGGAAPARPHPRSAALLEATSSEEVVLAP